MTIFDLEIGEDETPWAQEERSRLRASIGLTIAKWMIGATLIYIGLFYFLVHKPQAAQLSIGALVLHLIGWQFHQSERSFASTWSLLIALLHLALLDIFILHTTLSIFLWMITIPPFAVMACATHWERRGVTVFTIGTMVTCSILGDAYRQEPWGSGSILGIISIIGSTLLLTYITRWGLRQLERSQAMFAKEHELSESLLLNVLPQEIVGRLKHNPQRLQESTIADNYEHAAVMFADIVGFTELSSRLPPQKLVDLLNHYFTAFDLLSAQYQVEKIKTIGDAYMAATGILQENDQSLAHLARLALAIIDEVDRLNVTLEKDLNIRIGLHTGPVTAGVIGRKKFIYDLWGDTVNIAARMESHGIPGRVQVTVAVQEKLKERFVFESAGIKQIKGKGEMETFFLIAERPL